MGRGILRRLAATVMPIDASASSAFRVSARTSMSPRRSDEHEASAPQMPHIWRVATLAMYAMWIAWPKAWKDAMA